jgi:hypothetical protein
MIIHVLSVGLSLLTAMNERSELFGPAQSVVRRHRNDIVAAMPRTADNRAAAWLTEALGTTGEAPARLANLVRELHPLTWPSAVSAEVQTYSCAPDHRRPLPADATAILIASDTGEGLASALWNAAALTGDPARIGFVPDVDRPVPMTGGQAVIVQIPGMDAGDENGFRTAMRALGAFAGRSLVPPLERGARLRMHLSGGYKAAIPYLIALAEALRSRSDQISACVLHESAVARAGDRARAIDLPLRRLTSELLRSELCCFDPTGVCRDAPGQLVLRGYAYDKQDESWRLTPFGDGLRALLDTVPPSLGG